MLISLEPNLGVLIAVALPHTWCECALCPPNNTWCTFGYHWHAFKWISFIQWSLHHDSYWSELSQSVAPGLDKSGLHENVWVNTGNFVKNTNTIMMLMVVTHDYFSNSPKITKKYCIHIYTIWYKTKFGSQNFGCQLWRLFCNICNVFKKMFNVGLIIMW